MKKKILVVLASILIILLLVIIIREITLNFDGFLDKSNVKSRDEIKALIINGNSYNNFKLTSIVEDDKYEYYNKDNISTVYKNGDLVTWVDYNNSLGYFFNNSEKTATESNQFHTTEYSQYGRPFDEINDSQIEYKYLGQKNINNRATYIISLTSKNYIIKLYIDASTGVVINRKDILKTIITTHYTNEDFEVSFDTVTEKDIALPNLDEYTIIKNT